MSESEGEVGRKGEKARQANTACRTKVKLFVHQKNCNTYKTANIDIICSVSVAKCRFPTIILNC